MNDPLGYVGGVTRLLYPRSLTVLTTNNCTARCRHCSMRSGPDRTERLTYTQIEPILTQAFAELELEFVAFAGGEPTLLGEDLLKALRLCRAHGVPTRIITNAFWAHTPEAARATLRELRDAGLDQINLSTDDYHLPWISLQRIRNAFEAARELDFSSVAIGNCSGPQSALTPARINSEFGGGQMRWRYDEGGRSLDYDREVGGQMIVVSNARTQRIGRATEEMSADEFQTDESVNLQDELGGCSYAVRSPGVTPNGHLVSCCSFELEDNPILDYGDLREQPLSTVLDAADEDLITNLIAILGPPKIKQALEELCPDELDFPAESYQCYCEVCHDLVTRPQNRRAMLRHCSAFASLVLEARARARARRAAASAGVSGGH